MNLHSMAVTLRISLIVLCSCETKKEVKDISEVFPEHIELKLEQLKDLSFAADTNSTFTKFSDLDLPANSIAVFTLKDSARIRQTADSNLVKDIAAAKIPCCSFEDTYRNVPFLGFYSICFYRPDLAEPLPIAVREKSNRSVTTDIVTVKRNNKRIGLRCFTGWVEVKATVKCIRCPGNPTICVASYELFGVERNGLSGIPSNEYRVGTSTSTIPCGNCPPGHCANGAIR